MREGKTRSCFCQFGQALDRSVFCRCLSNRTTSEETGDASGTAAKADRTPRYRRVAASPRRRVAAELIAAIEAGEYPPGSQLPGEARLAERFQRPRNTVHSALGELDGRGLVEVVHDKGRIVLARPGDT
jgi:hypothetical protein